MSEGHKGYIHRSDKILIKRAKEELAKELGRPVSFADQELLDAKLAGYGKHFEEQNNAHTVRQHLEAAAARGVSYVFRHGRKLDRDNTGD